ncbi:unnamed protein product [Brachionus calyciflorus]|uniref:Uncharacterized protein n=1 Tax=Brachionus calyciflorus TaxID=104777 RepID=A0A814NFV6_9BILA|nr:unnamed protein product [Brachionus calyciflorus]
MNLQDYKNYLKHHKKLVLLIVIPTLASVIPIMFQNKQANCAFVVIIMSLYWITECLPIAITSLIPIVLFPVFGIMSSKNVTRTYFQDIILLFYGGLVMANAIEISGLHERLSLKFLLLFGSNPKWIMLGFMTITAFMSLWISNAASCSMMLPIINAVVLQLVMNDEIYHEKATVNGHDNLALNVSVVNLVNKISPDEKQENKNQEDIFKISKKARNLSTGFLLSCSYASTIGGLGSLVGTPPNILLKGFIDDNYPNFGLGFLNFSLVSLPISFMLLLTSWVWISFRWLPKEYFFGRNSKVQADTKDDGINQIIKEKYQSLGPAT